VQLEEVEPQRRGGEGLGLALPELAGGLAVYARHRRPGRLGALRVPHVLHDSREVEADRGLADAAFAVGD